jgi:hypothetical protein
MPLLHRFHRAIAVPVAILVLTISPQCDSRESPPSPSKDEVHVEMKNVSYHYTDGIAVHVHQLEGTLKPTTAGRVPIFDDTTSFMISASSGQMSITVDSMAHVLNDYVFAKKDSPLKSISIQASGSGLLLKGRKGPMPFEALVTLSVTPDGEILLHTEKMKVAHLPVKGLMELLGVDVADLVNTRKIEGIKVQGDDLILNTEKVLPPPHIQCKVSSVSVRGNEIVETVGGAEKFSANVTGNYMAYRGGSIGFGKLTMAGTDLVLIDMDSKDPFDFYFQRYKDQLTAGYSKTTNNFGLRVFMRDFNKLPPERRGVVGK